MLRIATLPLLFLLCACHFPPSVSEGSLAKPSTHMPVTIRSISASEASWLISETSASFSQSLQKAYSPELIFQLKTPVTDEFWVGAQSLQLTITRNRSLFGNVADDEWFFCGQGIIPDYQGSSNKWSKGQHQITLKFDLKNYDRSAVDCEQELLSLRLYLYPADRPVKAELSNPVITIGWIEK